MFSWDKVKKDSSGKILLLYRHERMFEEGLFSKPKEVLDLGGWGMLATRLIEEGHQCLILDNFSDDQYYPDRVRSLPHVSGDILEIDIATLGSFDVVTCFEMLEHCSNQAEAIKRVYSLLKIEGVFVGTVPIPGFAHKENEPHVQFIDEQRLRYFLEAAGFTDIVVEPTGSITSEETPCSLYFKARK